MLIYYIAINFINSKVLIILIEFNLILAGGGKYREELVILSSRSKLDSTILVLLLYSYSKILLHLI